MVKRSSVAFARGESKLPRSGEFLVDVFGNDDVEKSEDLEVFVVECGESFDGASLESGGECCVNYPFASEF